MAKRVRAAKTLSLQTVLLLILAAVILTALFVMTVVKSSPTSSEAAKGGKGGGAVSTVYGSCSVSPNPAVRDSQFTINGTGFKASQFLQLRIDSSAGSSFVWTQADGAGNFAQVWQVHTTGVAKVSVYDAIASNKVVLTSCSVQVN